MSSVSVTQRHGDSAVRNVVEKKLCTSCIHAGRKFVHLARFCYIKLKNIYYKGANQMLRNSMEVKICFMKVYGTSLLAIQVVGGGGGDNQKKSIM